VVERRTLAWAGCGLSVFLVVVALLAVVYYSVQSAKRHVGQEAEPADRTAAALSILGARTLPDGYYAVAGMTLPGLVQAVVLTDVPPGADGRIDRFENRLFIYLETRTSAPAGSAATEIETLLDVWPGRLKLELQETLSGGWERARGTLRFPTWQATYRLGRGIVSLGPGKLEGAFTLVSLECTGDDRQRTALWFDTRSGDPESLKRFLNRMEPCGL